MTLLLCLLGAWVALKIWVPTCCVLFVRFLSLLMVSVVGFCFRLFLVLLLCCLRRPCECAFCCFYVLVCFAVGVRCTSELVACFVCVCACVVSFCLCVSRGNLLAFAVVVGACVFASCPRPCPCQHPCTRAHTHTCPCDCLLQLVWVFAFPISLLTWSTLTLENDKIEWIRLVYE